MITRSNPRLQRTIVLLAALVATPYEVAAAKAIYVDDDATGANDGSSWAHAYTYLQDALDDAILAEKPSEIRVAQGIYKPDHGSNYTLGDREAAFELINGVVLVGGYAGVVGVDPDARGVRAYETVLSGDLAGNDAAGAAGAYDLWEEPTRAENSYHVVTSGGTDGTAVLDGFTVMGGNANGSGLDNSADDEDRLTRGGGLYSASGDPFVVNCMFRENSARYGGGISNSRSNPALANCTFRCNYAERYGGGMDNAQSNPSVIHCTFTGNSSSWGGGMSNRAQSNATVSDCTFSENKVTWYGGGMMNVDSDATVSHSTFRANEARLGGGMRNSWSRPALANCLFVDNVAYCLYGSYSLDLLDGHGGGMFNSNSTPALTNCTFSRNCAGEYAGGICNVQSVSTLANCIVWGNSLPQVSGDAIVSYSNIEGGCAGESNLNTDPLFADPAHGDCHLRSRAGRWNPVEECWVADDLSSRCIDAGDPSSPVGDEPLPNGGRINMGAYGGTAEASKSPE